MGILRKTSIETRLPSRAVLKAHGAEKTSRNASGSPPQAFDNLSDAQKEVASAVVTANNVKVARMRANLVAQAACLENWERRLKQRERQLIQSEDALESMANLHCRRSGTVLHALRLQWGRETAAFCHHTAGLLLLALIVACFMTIAANWQVKNWQCNDWLGMACWGVMGFTVIAGMSFITRIWIEERATDSKERGAFVFACILPFIHFLTCLSAALWSVGAGSMCHAK